MFKPVVIIPCFNHADTLESVVKSVLSFEIPVIVINDGSTIPQTATIKTVCETNNCIYVHHTPNGGKGAAMKQGFFTAHRMGFTHALQIDADGQHDMNDIPRFLEMSRNNPDALITGQPLYDETAPRSRMIGRKITDFWVMVETFNRHMPDAMCGFRVYPLAATLPILDGLHFNRMGFDIEIMVKMYRNCTRILPISTRVIYPESGISHFRLWRDNFYISLMHTYLFFTIPAWKIRRLLKKCTKK